LKQRQVYFVEEQEEELSDKHKISIFEDSKFDDATIDMKCKEDHKAIEKEIPAAPPEEEEDDSS